MVKGVDLQELLKALPKEGRADFAERLRREGGVEATFTVAEKHRKRKHRFHGIGGKNFCVRFQGADLEKFLAAVAASGAASPGLYLKELFLKGSGAATGAPGSPTVGASFEHGTDRAYKHFGCRCALCTKAHSEAMKAYHHSRRARAER